MKDIVLKFNPIVGAIIIAKGIAIIVILVILVIMPISSENKYAELKNPPNQFSEEIFRDYIKLLFENIRLQAENSFLSQQQQQQQQGDNLIIPPEDEAPAGENEFKEDDLQPEENEIEEAVPLIISDNKVIDI